MRREAPFHPSPSTLRLYTCHAEYIYSRAQIGMPRCDFSRGTNLIALVVDDGMLIALWPLRSIKLHNGRAIAAGSRVSLSARSAARHPRLHVQVCASHGVSPRDRWLCVLPRGQMNVNVNVYTRSQGTVLYMYVAVDVPFRY